VQEQESDVSSGPTGVPECDDLIAKYKACVGLKAPEDARERTLADFDVSVEAWKKDSEDPTRRGELARGCGERAVSLQKTTDAWGCEW
jgi:hypothetical protein